MTRIPLPAAVAATVLLALSLSACGGPPTDASKPGFCEVANDRSWAEDLPADADGEQIVDGFASWSEDLEEVGTPEGIPEDARKGFEVTVDYLGDLDPDDFEDLGDAAEVTDDLSEDEQEEVDAYNAYVAETCVPDTTIDVPEPTSS